MRKSKGRQPHGLPFRFLLVLAGASLLLTALAPRTNAGSTDYWDVEDPLGSRPRPAPELSSQPQGVLTNQPLAFNDNPNLALNVASGEQRGAFQPLQVDALRPWTGAVDTTWNNAGNWTAGGPPLSIDTAVFNSAFTNQPNVTISRLVGSLLMTDGVAQNVTISSSAAQILTIDGVGIPGTGILIDNASAFTLTVTARIGLDASQTWTNNSGNLFTVSGTTLGLGEDNTLVVNGTGNTLISAVTDGAGMGSSIIKDGSGTLTLTGTNAYSGGTTVIGGGTLLVNNTIGSGTGDGDVTVTGAGTTLGGTGIISERVTVNIGANIAPGNGGHTTSVLTVGAVTLSPGANFLVDINGTSPGTGYDRLIQTANGNNTFVITNSNLVVTVGTTLSVGQTFLIGQRTAGGSINGQFLQGSTVTGSDGSVFAISYTGGNGNDIVLTVLYAANPSVFVSPGHGVAVPIGLAADPGHLYVSQYFDNQIRMVDCNGNGTLFGTLPAPLPNILTEKYMALVPAESAAAGFTPGDLFVTLSEKVFKATPPNGTFTPFADWSGVLGGCPFSDHSAITFDKVGTFGFKMIITCETGPVFTIDGNANVTFIANTTDAQHLTHIEGPAVLPASFGPLGGQIMVADDIYNQVYAIDNMGNVTYNPFGFPGDGAVFTGAEQILVIPEFPCSYCGDRAFFQASAAIDWITSYPSGDFTGLGGDILIPTERRVAQGTLRGHFDVPSLSYQFFIFNSNSISNEGGTFVDCDVPTPTPTPTASPSPTPTPAAGNFSWTGVTNTIWSTSTNWSPSGPPTASETAVFNGAFTNQPNVTANAIVGSLLMTTGVAQNVTLSSSGGMGGAILTIGGVSDTGILINNTSAFAFTITARVGLDASQIWTNNSGNLFTVSGTTLGLGEDNTLTINGSGNTLISAVTDGAGMGSAIIKNGSGTLTITRNNAYSGGTTVNGGTILVNNTTGSGTGDGDVTLNGAGTTLGGTGIISKRVTANMGANLALGNGGHTTSILTVGKVTLSPGANFLVDINGTSPGTGYDRLVQTAGGNNTFVITNSNLVVTVGTTLSVGQTFLIGQRTAGGPINGQFLQGNTVTGSDGTVFLVSYTGGPDANDIVLTVVQVAASPRRAHVSAVRLRSLGSL